MSTFALINIEGSLSVPRSRPLAALPASFGGEWRLLPPGFCPRDDLKALYAALLRTFCLSDDAMLSMCRWLPRVAADVAKAGVGAVKSVASAGAAKAQPVGPVASRAEALARHETSGEYAKRMMTGGAIAISASTVLAWLAISHAPQDVTFSPDVLIPQASQAVRTAIDEARRSKT